MSRELPFLQRGLLQGKLPGMREWKLYYVEVSNSQVHIYEGQEGGSQTKGKHLRSLEICGSDMVGLDSKSKREIRFYLLRADGKYTFKCRSHPEREDWINKIQGVVSRAFADERDDSNGGGLMPDDFQDDPSAFAASLPEYPRYPPPSSSSSSRAPRRGKSFNDKKSCLTTPLPPTPGQLTLNGNSPRASIVSNDSGIGPSVEGEVRRSGTRSGATSMPNSGDSTFCRPTSAGSGSKSDGGKFDIRQQLPVRVSTQQDDAVLEVYKWFWGCMSRQECESRLMSEGKVGNFVVRINANGSYIMSFWRADGVHHHKIIRHGNIFRFERAAVSAEGVSLVDLLDTYMKDCVTDKSIRPFGGALHVNYDEAWNPPDIDMNQLSQRLKEQKLRKDQEKQAKLAKKSHPVHKRQEYTPVEVDIGKAPVVLTEDRSSEGKPTIAGKNKPLPPPPVKSKSPMVKHTTTTQSLSELSDTGSRNPLVSASSSTGDVTFEEPSSLSTSYRHASNTDSDEGSPSPSRHGRPVGTQGWALPGVAKKSSVSDFSPSLKEPPPTAAKPKKQPPPPVAKHRPKPVTKPVVSPKHQPQQQQQQPPPPPPPDSPPPLDDPVYANWSDGPAANKASKAKPKPVTPKPSKSTTTISNTTNTTAATTTSAAAATDVGTVASTGKPEEIYQNWSSPKSSQRRGGGGVGGVGGGGGLGKQPQYANIDTQSPVLGGSGGKKTRKSPSGQPRHGARLLGSEQQQQPTGGGGAEYQNIGKTYMNQRR